MKILHYTWASYLESDIFDVYKQLNIDFDTFSWSFSDKNYDEKFIYYISNNIEVNNYDAIFSINYWPLLSIVCETYNILYISWCYDNPLNVRNIELTLCNNNNRVFCYDKIQTSLYQSKGYTNVSHLPLGINVSRLQKIDTFSPIYSKYAYDISFVGKLYESAFDKLLSVSDEYSKGFFQALLNCQQNLYGCFLFDSAIDQKFIDYFNLSYQSNYPKHNHVFIKDEIVYTLACEQTHRDRIILLSLLGSKYKTALYSNNSSSIIKNVDCFPPVDYISEMPYIFSHSKININPSLRAIQSGIPLRCLDVMGCGGFLLSNYQEEFLDYFVPDRDIVLYESYEDALDKVSYYLEHEDIRKKIAQNGHHIVINHFNLSSKLSYIFHNCFK